MRKVLVTGGAGYIGSHTCVELHQAGYLPVIVDDLRTSDERILAGLERIIGRALPLHRVDCTDAAALEEVMRSEGPFLGVIHFAAYKSVGDSVTEPVEYYSNNIGSLAALLQAGQRCGLRRIVFSSSCAVYGQADRLPVDETAPADRTNSPYGYTKVVCEQLLRDAVAGDPAWCFIALRYFNPIGAHSSGLIGELPLGTPTNLVPYVVQTAAGHREMLTVHGNDYATPDGSCLRDYLHVTDLAKAHVQALALLATSKPGDLEVINLGTGKPHSVLEVVHTFQRVSGVQVPFRIGPRRPGDVASIHADVTKAARVLGWRAELGLDQALQHAWAWQQRLDAVDALAKG